MAPDLFHPKGYGKAVDVWSAGIIMYKLICGKHPFKKVKNSMLDYAMVNDELNLEDLNARCQLWSNAKQLILQLLEKRASQRPTPTEAL